MKALGQRDTQEPPRPWVPVGRRRMEREGDEGQTKQSESQYLKQILMGARRKNGEEAEVRTDQCGDGGGCTGTKPESK